MTQRKSSEELYIARLFGQRLRDIRGKTSQEKFANRLNISRAALANYELGRSLPKDETITQICSILKLERSDLLGPPSMQDVEDAANQLFKEKDEPTLDEWAIIRALRSAEQQTVLEIVQKLTAEIEESPVKSFMSGRDDAIVELARLYTIVQRGGSFQKGMTSKSFIAAARMLAAAVVADTDRDE